MTIMEYLGVAVSRPDYDRGEPWQARAACAKPDVDPEWFFPRNPRDLEAAQALCASCPVKADCAKDRGSSQGVWAGELHGRRPKSIEVAMNPETYFIGRRSKWLEIMDLHKLGLSRAKIAARMGIGDGTVYHAVRTMRQDGWLT